MKSSLSPGQIKMLAAVLGFLLLAIGVGWFGLGHLSEKRAESEALGERMGNPGLAALLADPSGVAKAGRESAEIQALEKEFRIKEGAVMETWAKSTAEASGEGQEWSKDPGKWKDRLIEIQSQIQKQAVTHRIRLGPDFYLGLEAFRQKSPTAAEVPALAVHLSVAARLVELFMQARKAKEQYPTPCELISISGPGSTTDKSAEQPPPVPVKAGATPVGLDRKKFRVVLRCSPEVLLDYVHLLSRDSWLLIITDLSLKNTKMDFPLRSEIAKQFDSKSLPADGAASPPPAVRKKLLEILAGEESVTADLEVEFVAWRNSEANKAGANPSSK